jgi:hypothetical protein
MWKKMVIVAGLLCSLATGLVAAEPARADMPGGCIVFPPEANKEMIKVTIWGRLQEVTPKKGPHGIDNRYLAVVVNGREYKLDLGSKLALWQQAEKLREKRVIVEGELQGDRVVVSSVCVDPTDCAKDKIAAEIRGKLEIVEDSPKHPGLQQLAIWRGHLAVRANGQEFRLDLAGSGLDMWELNRQYRGQTVLVTGILEGDQVRVKAVKSDGEYILKTVTVEIKGKLQCLWIDPETGKFLSAHDTWGAYECIQTVPGLVVDGKVYRLQDDPKIPAKENPEKKYRELCGRTVAVTGTLEGETVTVRSIQAVDTPSVQQTVEIVVKGTLLCETVRPMIDPCPEHKISRTWKVRAEGKVYTLDFGGNKEVAKGARSLEGSVVVVRGTLKGTVITVTALEVEDTK